MKTGRPTRYSAQMLESANAYVTGYKEHNDAVPIVAGLASVLGVVKSTIYKWADEHPEFSDTLEAMQQEQERVLASGGLMNTFNSTITKLMLHNHGYSDKSEVDSTQAITVIGINKDFGDD